MSTIQSYLEQAVRALGFIKPIDILDILIFAVIVYKLIMVIRSTAAMRLVKGIAIFAVVTIIAYYANMRILYFLLDKAIDIGILALVILFQPELRRILERLGSSSLWELLGTRGTGASLRRVIGQTVAACDTMSQEKVGALICFERSNSLDEYFKTGTVINADVSTELLKNIFFPKAALHDGAVVIRNGRIAAAGCVLPLTDNPGLSRDLGTRHRAGIGLSEASDAVVVIVSEETVTISMAVGGMLKRPLDPQMLDQLLIRELKADEQDQTSGLVGKIRNLKWVKRYEEKQRKS